MVRFTSVRSLCRFSILAMAFLLLTAARPAAALTVPPLDSASPFAEYGMGYSDGDLYLHTGDTIHRLGQDGGGNDQWQPHVTGLESAFASGPRAYEGAFATAPGGRAAVAFGFTDGGVLTVDLAATTTAEVPALDTDNLFSLAGAPDGTFYGMKAFFDLNTFTFNATQIVHIDPVTGNVDVVVDELSPGEFSGGLVVDDDGNLYASTFFSAFPAPVGTATIWKLSAAELALPNPTPLVIGSAATNGANAMAVNSLGDLFFASQTGIGVLRNGASSAETFFGDLTLDPFSGPTAFRISNALTVDPATDELLFIDRSGQTPTLVRLPSIVNGVVVVPEPGSAMLLGAAGMVLAGRLRRRV